MNSLQELLAAQYGIQTESANDPETTSVGTTVVEILKNNPRRLSVIFVNTGLTYLYLGRRETVSSTTGIWLPPSGSSLALRWDVDGILCSEAWYALSSGAGGTIHILETLIRG